MTRTPLSRSKGQRSRSPGGFSHRGVMASASTSCSGCQLDRGKVLTVGTEDADSRLLRCAEQGAGHRPSVAAPAPLQAAQLVFLKFIAYYLDYQTTEVSDSNSAETCFKTVSSLSLGFSVPAGRAT